MIKLDYRKTAYAEKKSSPLMSEREQDKTRHEFINIKKPSRENTYIGTHSETSLQYLLNKKKQNRLLCLIPF